MKKLKVTNDFIFKKIFGKQENENLLKDLLKSIMHEPIEKIQIQKDAVIEKALETNKIGILDIKAILNDNTVVNIEIQVENQYNIVKRSLFYWAGLYHNGLKRGAEYEQNRRTICISILNYNEFEEGTYHEVVKLRREYENKLLTKDLELHYIQIPKFNSEKEKIETELEQWLQFIGDISKKGVAIKMETSESMQETARLIEIAEKELEYLEGDEEIQRLAELREKAIKDEKSNLEGARRRGIKEGIEEGIKIIAREMLKKNIEIDVIVSVTGLSKEEIKEL